MNNSSFITVFEIIIDNLWKKSTKCDIVDLTVFKQNFKNC